jgi:hypothetical protein
MPIYDVQLHLVKPDQVIASVLFSKHNFNSSLVFLSNFCPYCEFIDVKSKFKIFLRI